MPDSVFDYRIVLILLDTYGTHHATSEDVLVKASSWRRVRQVVQALILGIYLYLLLAALPQREAFPLADLFFRLDPLATLGSILASRTWIPNMALALFVLALTVALGRVWCGWLCPLGTLLEWVRFRSDHHRAESIAANLRKMGKILLFVMLIAALLGNLTLFILDPLTLLTRTMTTVILPVFNTSVTAVERALYEVPFMRPAVNALERFLRDRILPVEQPFFSQGVFIAVVFAGMLALNSLADRFWCRFLCPLGALLGLLSKISIFRPVIGDSCKGCALCLQVCRLGAIETEPEYEIAPSECTGCLDCFVACRPKDIRFQFAWKLDPVRSYDMTRREALAAMATGALGVAILQTGVHRRIHHPLLLRPPGVEDENVFLAKCLRCSQCMRVCPTSGLQPVLAESGTEGVWTPRLVPRLGYCDYGCNACGQSCPTGALPTLDLARKREAVIGAALIDPERCLPWAKGVPCIVCEEMCPMPEKAVKLEQVSITDPAGMSVVIQRPSVLEHLCIGCGICEYKCPVEGEAAIRVRRVG